MRTRILLVLVPLLFFLIVRPGCVFHCDVPEVPPPDDGTVLVTGYCNCGTCCGWKRSWFGFGEPVYDYGPMKGKPKRIGVTASGTKAKKGTVAADPAWLPFGTHLRIPGYGPATVEDVGGAIKGRHIDVWFPTHAEATRWGTRRLRVEIDRTPNR